MLLSLLIAENIASMLIMVLCGVALAKAGLLDTGAAKMLSTVSVFLIMPCNIITAFQLEKTPQVMDQLLLVTLAAVFIQLLLIGLSFLFKKPLRLSAIEQISSTFGNSGIIALCLVRSIMGDEYSVYVFPYMMFQIMLTWTYSMFMVGGREKINLKTFFTMPTVYAIFIGLFLFFGGISLPPFLLNTMTEIKACTGPIGMISIGLIIGAADLKALFSNIRIFIICLLKLIVFPALVMLILCLLPLERIDPNIWFLLLPSIICLSAPTANSVTTVAQFCDTEVEYASILNLTSVVFCIITMPVMIAFYELLM